MADISSVNAADIKEISDSLDALSCKQAGLGDLKLLLIEYQQLAS